MDLTELQTAVDAWIKTYGVKYFGELTNMAHSDRRSRRIGKESWPGNTGTNLSKKEKKII